MLTRGKIVVFLLIATLALAGCGGPPGGGPPGGGPPGSDQSANGGQQPPDGGQSPDGGQQPPDSGQAPGEGQPSDGGQQPPDGGQASDSGQPPAGGSGDTGSTSSGGMVSSGDCPADNFPNLTANSANSAYPSPEVTAYCEGDYLIVESNGIPSFEFIQTTPSDLEAQSYRWEIPLNPSMAAQTSSIPLGGAVAFTVTGLPIFGPTEAPEHGYRDPIVDELLDYCNGHTAGGGVYHFHAHPCDTSAQQPYVVVGYALDGFPILSPYVCEDDACTTVKEVKSSWQLKDDSVDNSWDRNEYVAGLGDLDQCNGMTLPDGTYAYFATNEFPYFMGCYVGTPATTTTPGGGGSGPPGGGQAPGGGGGQPPPGGGGDG